VVRVEVGQGLNARQVIVVDIESTGLKEHHVPIEVAAINLETGDEFYFVPYMGSTVASGADPDALRINRYFERGIYKYADRTPPETSDHYRDLAVMLKDNTLAGSNPRFDAGKISDQLRRIGNGRDWVEPWHHRLLDLSAYAAGVLGISPSSLPGLHQVCEALDIVNEEEHGAMGDARATAACFKALMAMVETRA
jgi:DNA polymerase-3 subunit epsilon